MTKSLRQWFLCFFFTIYTGLRFISLVVVYVVVRVCILLVSCVYFCGFLFGCSGFVVVVFLAKTGTKNSRKKSEMQMFPLLAMLNACYL